MSRLARCASTVIATIVGVMCVGLVTAVPAGAVTGYSVCCTGGQGLREHTAPTVSSTVVGVLADGTPLDIACQTRGDNVTAPNGVQSSVWDQLTNSYFISDLWVTTPNVNQFTPGIPQCGSPPPPPTYPTYHVYGTGGLGLNLRTGPGTTYSSVGVLADGTAVQIVCQTRSSSVIGGSSIWDQIVGGTYVTDYYIDTPVFNGFTSGINQCAGTITPTAPQPVATTFTVYRTGGWGLHKRTGPSMAYNTIGMLSDGTAVQISCQVRGERVTNPWGVSSSIWDELADASWVSDDYIQGTNTDAFTPGIPQCTSTPPAPSVGFPSRQTYGPTGRTIYGSNTTTTRSDPVNTATGSWWTHDTDVNVAGPGIVFSFVRSYTSADTASSGPLGNGWTDNLATKITIDAAKGDAIVTGEQNQRLEYAHQEDGEFVPAPGVTAKLAQTASGYELTRDDLTRYDYDTSGNLTTVTARDGAAIHLQYANGHLSKATDAAGRTYTFTYDTNGLLTTLTQPDGTAVHYGYTNGLLTSATDPAGATTTYSYDSNGRVTQVVDGNGHTDVANTYGPDGRVAQQTDGRGNSSTFTWDPATETSTMTDARGHTWTDVYHDNVLQKEIDPLGDTKTYVYDGDLNLVATIDGNGNQTSYTYDQQGNKLTQTAPAPLSYVQTWAYDSTNEVTSYTDGRGNPTTYSYDSAGNKLSETAPDRTTTQWTYVPNTNLVASKTDALGHTTSYEYDNAGDQTAVTDSAGDRTTFTYDPIGRRLTQVDPRGNVTGADPATYTTTFSYDADGRLTRQTDPLGHATVTTYDNVGNKTSVTDPNRNTTSFQYDADDHLAAVIAADGSRTSYSYDPTSNLVSRTDGNGNASGYTYDAANRRISQTLPNGAVTSYGYDANGNQTTITDAIGNASTNPAVGTTTKTYDELNRLTKTTYGDGTPAATYSYDADGNRTAMTDGNGTQTYSYDSRNHLTGTSRGTNTFTYSYDEADNLTSRTYPDGTAYRYSYDTTNRMTAVTVNGKATSYGYDPAGNQTSTTYPNGIIETRSYDAAGKLQQIRRTLGASTVNQLTYTRDAAGNPTKLVKILGTKTYTEIYHYNARQELTQVCYTATCKSTSGTRYSYDAVGNRTLLQQGTSKTTYTYNNVDELITTKSPTGVVTAGTYDLDGRQTTAGKRTFVYNLADQLTRTSQGTSTSTYSYDGDGNRLTATTGKKTTTFVWDINNSLPMLALEKAPTSTIRYGYGTTLLDETVGTTDAYYQTDAIGTVIGLADQNGLQLWTYQYDPWGKQRTATHVMGAPANNLRYTGQYLDTTGLYYMRARQYDPTAGRFTEGDPASANVANPYVATYVYAHDRPTDLIDPTGKSAWSVTSLINDALSAVNLGSDALSFAGTLVDTHQASVDCATATWDVCITSGAKAIVDWASIPLGAPYIGLITDGAQWLGQYLAGLPFPVPTPPTYPAPARTSTRK